MEARVQHLNTVFGNADPVRVGATQGCPAVVHSSHSDLCDDSEQTASGAGRPCYEGEKYPLLLGSTTRGNTVNYLRLDETVHFLIYGMNEIDTVRLHVRVDWRPFKSTLLLV